MDWQQIAVVVVVGAAFVFLLGRLFSRRGENTDSCSSCSDMSCPLRDLKSKKKKCK